MSKRKIVITIDCNAKTCGECDFWQGYYHFCQIFSTDADNKNRCPECLRAEKEANNG